MSLRAVDLVAIGTSAGGVSALRVILNRLQKKFPFPIVVVQHLPSHSRIDVSLVYGAGNQHRVVEVEDKMILESGVVYMAAPSYHLLLEKDMTLALSQDEPVNYSRPSIDVFFESVSAALGRRAMGVLMTGANGDGASGLSMIQKRGGVTAVQTPEEAEAQAMPRAALELMTPDYIMTVAEIGDLLNEVAAAKQITV